MKKYFIYAILFIVFSLVTFLIYPAGGRDYSKCPPLAICAGEKTALLFGGAHFLKNFDNYERSNGSSYLYLSENPELQREISFKKALLTGVAGGLVVLGLFLIISKIQSKPRK